MKKFILKIVIALLWGVLSTTKANEKEFVPLVIPYTWGDNTVQLYAAETPFTNEMDTEFAKLIEGNYTEEDKATITVATATASNGIKLFESIISHLPQSIETRLKSIVTDVIRNHDDQIQKCQFKLTAKRMQDITKCATDEAPEIIDAVNKTVYGLHNSNELITTVMSKFRNCMATYELPHNLKRKEPSRFVKICQQTLEWSKKNGCLLLVGGEIVLDITTFIWHITVKTLESYSTIKVRMIEEGIARCAKGKLDGWLSTSCKHHVPVLDRR